MASLFIPKEVERTRDAHAARREVMCGAVVLDRITMKKVRVSIRGLMFIILLAGLILAGAKGVLWVRYETDRCRLIVRMAPLSNSREHFWSDEGYRQFQAERDYAEWFLGIFDPGYLDEIPKHLLRRNMCRTPTHEKMSPRPAPNDFWKEIRK
jgi:hypothetical protein